MQPRFGEKSGACWRHSSDNRRRKAYYLMTIHEHLTRVSKPQLREMGWTKSRELVKVARKDETEFASCTWVHKAKELPREEFKREVERHLTAKETKAWEIIYFKLYKSQLPVVERALEIAALMLGGDKSRGYSLEMICADFLAGAALATDGTEQNLGRSAFDGCSSTISRQPASIETMEHE